MSLRYTQTNTHSRATIHKTIQIRDESKKLLRVHTVQSRIQQMELMFFTLKQWRCGDNMLISYRLWWYLNEDENHPINPRHYHIRLTSPINSCGRWTKSFLYLHKLFILQLDSHWNTFIRFVDISLLFFYTNKHYRWDNTYRDVLT